MSEEKVNIPTPEEFYFEVPIYTKYKLTDESIPQLFLLENPLRNVKYYCPECGELSVYKVQPGNNILRITALLNVSIESVNEKVVEIPRFDNKGFMQEYKLPREYFLHLKCQSNCSFDLSIDIKCKGGYLIKAGMYPALAKLQDFGLNKYKIILKKTELVELKRAVGLASHGVGVGSFVYLRRIIEPMIEDSFNKLLDASDDNPELKKLTRVSDKINLCSGYLPDFLVSNSSIYSILSKGIHELKEEECLEYFDVMLESIKLILDQKIELYEKEKKVKRLSNLVNKIHSDIK